MPRKPLSRFIALLGWVLLALLPAGTQADAAVPGPNDRWVEIDLYWFDDQDIDGSADRFWARYAPLFENVDGERGVILNLAMTVNYIMDYRQGLDQVIVLPKGTGQELGARIEGQLVGTTAERQAAWRERYREPANSAARSGYGNWSYAKLRQLAQSLRSEAARRGISGFKVGSLIVGSDGTYGELSPFAQDHPEAWTRWPVNAAGALASSSNFDPSALLHTDPTPRRGLPDGIREGMPVHAAFAAQWGAFSREVGLDALMLRDSMSFPRAYTRYGPYGETVPDAQTAERLTNGLSALIRESKLANRNALIMMYSTGATAAADWRANGIDLERIAGEGYLDIFVDQTWAGAWNEVGVRQQTFWNAPLLGWTYQLSYMMQHAAVLAKSKVRHYFLTDTFDAWESWDTIHTAPERLRWAIWAYSHIAVKTPDGLRVPAGSYISWANRGDDLLTADDVAFLTRELDDAAHDARGMREVFGPTLVYSRDVAAAQLKDGASRADLGDRLDEQIGSIVKWPVPILSITRLEWLSDVTSPLFVFGTTKPLPDREANKIRALGEQGQAMAFFGSIGDSLHPALRDLAGVSSVPHQPRIQDRSLVGVLARGASRLPATNIAAEFPIPPTRSKNSASADDAVVYAVAGSAALVHAAEQSRDILVWDPPQLADYWFRPLRDNMNGSPVPYVLTAAALTAQLSARHALAADRIDPRQSAALGAWRRRDGRISLLLGNLEEGLQDDADRSRSISLTLPPSWQDYGWESRWAELGGETPHGPMVVRLRPQASELLTSTPP